MANEPIYLTLSPEIEELLNDNQIDLQEELRKQDLEVEIQRGQLPGSDGQTREVVLIILASAAAFAAVSAGVAHVIGVIAANRAELKEEEVIEPIMTPSGEIVKGNNNQPIFQRVKRYRYVQPNEVNQPTIEVGAKAGDISFEISTKA